MMQQVKRQNRRVYSYGNANLVFDRSGAYWKANGMARAEKSGYNRPMGMSIGPNLDFSNMYADNNKNNQG